MHIASALVDKKDEKTIPPSRGNTPSVILTKQAKGNKVENNKKRAGIIRKNKREKNNNY